MRNMVFFSRQFNKFMDELNLNIAVINFIELGNGACSWIARDEYVCICGPVAGALSYAIYTWVRNKSLSAAAQKPKAATTIERQ